MASNHFVGKKRKLFFYLKDKVDFKFGCAMEEKQMFLKNNKKNDELYTHRNLSR